ncbi:TBC1 domain family member 10A isoform X3 [Sapajus apella]|uniref:TBC1 domain family member 10A isoform X3 n=1 Tax=Sapajus apella TaxID=9515 RepID=A0A6J3G3S3_SAPAP|nr:TBC1 domain family member 10A isoform X3 [Sapajus apella]
MAKSNGENGPRAPAAGESLSGTRESLAQGPDAATTDELSSLGSDSEANGFAERRIDKFGFIVGSQGAEGALEEVPLEVLRQRESKWLDMLNNWDKWMAKKHKKELDMSPGDPKWLDVIERDLHRQFPFHEMFVSRGGHGQQDLFRVLKAYTLYRPEEGYCQAQAPIAAVLLMHMPAEQAFWCLVQICEKYLPGYYSEKLEAIQLDGEILFSLLQKVSPVAHKHLSRQKIDPLLYMTEWFMCAFSRTLPWSSVLRVWDMFFCEGVKIIFRVGLVLLKHALGSPEKVKACQGQYETIERLRSLSPKIMQEAFLVQEVVELPVTERQIEREHLIQLRRWQETRGELQCRSPPRLHGAKAILDAEPGPRPTLQPSPSIRLPPDAPLPGSKAKSKPSKQAQKEQQKQTKARGQPEKPPAPDQAMVEAAAGDAYPPQHMPPNDSAPQVSAPQVSAPQDSAPQASAPQDSAPQVSTHHRSQESLTSQESEDTYL